MNEKIKLIKSNGTVVEGDIICFIEDTSSSKRYVYYTLNEMVNAEPSQNIKIYVAKVKQNDMTDTPISEEEWSKLKGFMGDVLKDVESPTVKYLPQSELVEPTIVDEKVIAMPTMYDYISKHRGVYATKVASMVSEPTLVVDASENVAPEVVPTQIETPTIPEAPVVDTPMEQVAPLTEENPIVPDATAQKVPSVEPQIITPEVQPVVEENEVPISEPIKESEPVVLEPTPSSQSLERIDIASIEKKYDEMIASITELRNKEIEAANRYNATLELSAMHNAQHADYVQSEQTPETANTPALEPTPIQPAPIEPEPIAPQVSDINIETNWFDMQPQG